MSHNNASGLFCLPLPLSMSRVLTPYGALFLTPVRERRKVTMSWSIIGRTFILVEYLTSQIGSAPWPRSASKICARASRGSGGCAIDLNHDPRQINAMLSRTLRLRKDHLPAYGSRTGTSVVREDLHWRQGSNSPICRPGTGTSPWSSKTTPVHPQMTVYGNIELFPCE